MFDFYGFVLLLTALAGYRLTRLAVDDEFPPIRAARQWVVGLQVNARRGAALAEALGDLVTCRYCASGWITLGLTFAANYGFDVELGWVGLAFGWFAVWALTVIIYNYADPDDRIVSEPNPPVALDVATLQHVTDQAAVKLVPRFAAAARDLVNERAVPELSARGYVILASDRVSRETLVRYALELTPADQRATVVANALRAVNDSATATTTTGVF